VARHYPESHLGGLVSCHAGADRCHGMAADVPVADMEKSLGGLETGLAVAVCVF
jgi:hypothetical protein